jgi:hypothetical protein
MRRTVSIFDRTMTQPPAELCFDHPILQFVYGAADGPVRATVLSGMIAKSDKELRERVTAAVRPFPDGGRDSAARRS